MAAVTGGMLVVNPGSSTIKYALFDTTGQQLLRVQYDKRDARCERTIQHGDERNVASLPMDAFRETEKDLVAFLAEELPQVHVEYIGFRVVHGGPHLTKTTQITKGVMEALQDAARLAPLHNPPCIALIHAWEALWPHVPQYAVFDTAFHAQMPQHATTYALPKEIREATQIRRYGFHGISYASLLQQLQEATGKIARRIIACHLGSGSSICAVQDGRSIDTSMGATPLEGLVMGTRVGDMDPGGILLIEEYLAREQQGGDVYQAAHEELSILLYKKSGLLGLTGTHDMREVLRRSERGEPEAVNALDLYCYHVQKYIGSFYAILGGCDTLIFSGGIGQGSALVREKILEPLTHLGLRVDLQKNRDLPREGKISDKNFSADIWVFDAEEERQIFRDVTKLHGTKI